ncbi:hypothetical protein CC85DRAFT_327011 [Cutaneotrichosporon oleaginosum]|uniref:Uncharacterized protein n=1 Tax=Cutaneotrichosporon oleaginosum TaxID=879819 RepID=A0A0J0XS14_9TREE|nr:uncharacterized protein CC85DRAFT_327011 [Cutaneotrichosporon oleaginosum]KLT43880.1 hypothetical protein CC85DRAFT_327011 [Cutaneotrichosporon oleaginosum]TXT06380.1 hypothetical protein COLE_05711 [Cutaneotrichosporon oleaginosum]
MQSSASDVTYVSVPPTPTTKYAPSFPPRSTSPTRKFPTPLPTPPQSAKHTEFPLERNHTRHTTQFLDEHVQQAWSNHPFAFSPSGRRSKSTSDPFKADFGAIFGVEEQPHEIVANYVDQQHPTPDSSPLMLPVELPFVNSSKARPRRGTFGSGDAPTYSGQCNENDFRRRQRYQYQDAYERAYACEGHGRWR